MLDNKISLNKIKLSLRNKKSEWNSKSLWCQATWLMNVIYAVTKVSSIYYVRKIFRKTSISYTVIRTRTCAYQEVRNVSFSENFAYVLKGWCQTSAWKSQFISKYSFPWKHLSLERKFNNPVYRNNDLERRKGLRKNGCFTHILFE